MTTRGSAGGPAVARLDQRGPLRASRGLPRARAGARRARRRPESRRARGRRPGPHRRSSAPCPPARASSAAARYAAGSPTTGHAGRAARYEAVLHAMQGRLDQARALHAEADQIIDDLGSPCRRPIAASDAGRSSCSPEHRNAPRPRHARALSSSRTWAPRAMARPPPHSWPSRSSDKAATTRPSATPTSPQRGPRPTTPPRRCTSSPPAPTSSRARGEFERAEAAAREAVRLSERSDDISQRGDALVDLAHRARSRGTRRRSGRGAPRRHRALRTQGQRRLRLPRACDREPPWTSR